jgi:CDP-glycerol glycerophosphotransferase
MELLGRMNLPAVRSRIHWLIPLLRAELIVTDAVRSPLALGRFRFIQLWHGTGFKRIGLEREGRSALGRFLVGLFGKKTLFVLATSPEDAERKRRSLGCPRVEILGSPRNDGFAPKRGAGPDAANRLSDGGVVLYAPTYRERGWDAQPISEETWRAIDRWCASEGWQLLVKRHPSDDTLKVPNNLQSVRDVTEETEDVQRLIGRCDVLISDYSGIVTDAAAADVPVLWYMPDLVDYKRSRRGFYYDIPEDLPGPVELTEEGLLSKLTSMEWLSDPSYVEGRAKFARRFHTRNDGRATARVLKAVERAIGAS